MQLGRRLSSGVAQDPPAHVHRTEPVRRDAVASPDQQAAEIVAAAVSRELGELASGH